MIAQHLGRPRQASAYSNGNPYSPARGRYAPRQPVEDYLEPAAAVVDLPRERVTAEEFVQRIVQEMKIRFYRQKSVKTYRSVLQVFLRWLGPRPLHTITRGHVRAFLELLVDAGHGASWVSGNLSAIRTAFDKMCGCQITLGLLTPRRPKRLPVVLSIEEILQLLMGAISLRDKLLIGLMYATGVRVSEVVRLRWRDIDFDRCSINVWEGKGRTDRVVMLPECFKPLLQELNKTFHPEDYIFPGDRRGRHLSPRTVQRVMKRTLRIAGIGKKATPHSLRHSFACHLFEDRTDIQTIQKLLGHAKIETTTIYTKVAVLRRGPVTSPLDTATGHAQASGIPTDSRIAQLAFPRPEPSKRTVGHMKIELKPRPVSPDAPPSADVTLSIRSDGVPIELSGIVVRQPRPQWITLEVPLLETWREPLKWLTREQRERIESADFYELLQKQIGERFLRECQGLK